MPSALELLTEIIDSPIGPRGITVRRYVSRRATRKAVREGIEQVAPAAAQEAARDAAEDADKRASFHPALHALSALNFLAKAAALYKEAPFKSQAQRRKFYAMAERGEISRKEVRKWESETPKGKKLPERLHKKEALLGALPFLAMVPGKGLAARAARGIGWGSIPAGAAVAGAKKPPVTGPPGIRQASLADRLVELTKHAIEFHSHSPASTDAVEPDVKKNDGKTAAASISSSSVTARTTVSSGLPGATKGRFSPTKPKKVDWYMRGLPGDSPLPSGPSEMNVASGTSPQAATAGVAGSSHVQRPAI